MASLDLVLGIACVLSGTAINSIGLILQKREVNKSGVADASNIAPFLKRPLWVLGILMQTIIFAPFFFIGIDLVGIALAQPLATAGLLVFVAGAVLVLKEKLSRIEWVGVSLMIAAIFFVSIAGVSGDVTISVFFQPSFVLNAIIFIIVIVLIVVYGVLLLRLSKKHAVDGLAILFGTSYAVVSITGQLVTTGFGGLLSPATEALGWILLGSGLAGVVIGTVFGILLSQRAFQQAQAMRIVPISQPINNVLPIVAGIYVFGQNIVFLWLFIPGIILLLVAVILLARFQR